MVDQYSINSTYLKRIRPVFHQGLVHPWPYRIVRVDTMPYEASYKKQHIPGAVQMEFPIPEMTQLDDKAKAALEKLLGPDKERLIVFYCGFVKYTRSHNGAMWAVRVGYKNVYRHPGGIKAWDEADYPVEKVD